MKLPRSRSLRLQIRPQGQESGGGQDSLRGRHMERRGRVPMGVRAFPMQWTLTANWPLTPLLPPNPTPRLRPLPAKPHPESGALVPAPPTRCVRGATETRWAGQGHLVVGPPLTALQLPSTLWPPEAPLRTNGCRSGPQGRDPLSHGAAASTTVADWAGLGWGAATGGRGGASGENVSA